MRSLAESDDAVWAGVTTVLTDIDDTLTVEGRVPAKAFEAMERLRSGGIAVVPVTGRPAGWCDLIARQWPVDAVVGENGAFWFRYDRNLRRMLRNYADASDVRAHNRIRLARIGEEILAKVPGAALSADQAYRESDLAIDFCEDVTRLPKADIDRIAAIFARHGATAKVSSIHVNGWFGDHDKLTMTRSLMREIFALDIDTDASRVAFVGDSPNDAPMFAFFPNAVGVANLGAFADRTPHLPRWITAAPRGDGFVELAERILAAGKPAAG